MCWGLKARLFVEVLRGLGGGGGHVAQPPHRGWSFGRFLRFGLENGGSLFQYGGQQGTL